MEERPENFTTQSFDANKNYVSFYNLSGKKSSLANQMLSTSSGYFYDTMNVYYTYYTVTPPAGTSVIVSSPLPQYNNIFVASLAGRMAASAPYSPLPVLPLSYFYDNEGNLRIYNEDYGPLEDPTGLTPLPTMPYFVFNFLAAGNNIPSATGANQQFVLTCDYDPSIVDDVKTFRLTNNTANLNMLVESNGQMQLYPAVYIMELVFNRVYLMQVQQKL